MTASNTERVIREMLYTLSLSNQVTPCGLKCKKCKITENRLFASYIMSADNVIQYDLYCPACNAKMGTKFEKALELHDKPDFGFTKEIITMAWNARHTARSTWWLVISLIKDKMEA